MAKMAKMKKGKKETLGKILTLFVGIICFLGITAAARQELPIFKAMIEAGGSIVWEGATRDAYQTTFTVVDPTADRTITFPNSSGTVALNPAAGSIEFEGTTANEFETTLAVTDPTADRTVTIPNASGTVMLSTLATNAPDAANSVTGGTNGMVFEGATANAFETTITPTDPTADRTITLPNQSGTVVTTPYEDDLTLSSPSNNGANGAKNEFQGLMKFKLVALGTMTNGAAAGKTLALMDDSPDGEWAASDADVVVSSDNTLEKVGSNCLKIAFSVDSDTGDGAHDAGLAYDFTDDESVSFWIYSDGAFSAGDLVLDITDNGGNHTVDLPAIVANTWTYCDLTTGITAIANADKDSISDLSIELSAAGQAVVAGRATNIYVDGGWKWDSTEEEALSLNLVTDGIVGAFVLPAAAGATANIVENTDFFVHYESGNDFLVTVTDQSANTGVVAAMYQ